MKKISGVFPVAAAIAIQLTLGVAYIWSIFQTGIANTIFRGNHAAAGLTFSLLLALLGIGSLIGGKLAYRFSTRIVVFTGGIILSTGFFMASFVTAATPWLLWVTYGIMGGFGMGFTYSTTIACAQKWYPHKKGFVTGIIVASLGFGGVIFTPLAEMLIEIFGGEGAGEQKTFMVLSAIFLFVCTAGSIFMKNPPDYYMAECLAKAALANSNRKAAKPVVNYTTREMLKTPQFYLVITSFMLACMAGLMMIAFAKPFAIANGHEAAVATIGVMAITMFNSFGRLFWGFVSDKLGRKNTIIILLCGTALISLFVNAAVGFWIFILIALIGFFFGGLVSTYPPLTADLFGHKHMAANYGFVLLGFGIGAIASSQIAGYYKNLAVENINLMFPAFMIASCCAIAGIIIMFVLKAVQKAKNRQAEILKV